MRFRGSISGIFLFGHYSILIHFESRNANEGCVSPQKEASKYKVVTVGILHV